MWLFTMGTAGAIILGTAASVEAIIELKPWNDSQAIVNGEKWSEQVFESSAFSFGASEGVQVGVLHNMLIRSVVEKYGNEISQWDGEELLEVLKQELSIQGIIVSGQDNLNTISSQDIVCRQESDETIDDFIQNVCNQHPAISQELTVLKTILNGIDMIQSDQEALNYTTQAIQIIENSNVASDSKTTLVCGASVAFESKQLWNLSTNQ